MWNALNGMYLVCGCDDKSIYFVDSETGEIDEDRTLEGHTSVRIITIINMIDMYYLYTALTGI